MDTSTVLQPHMKTIKSVTKLSEKDIRDGDATNYVLTHQDVDSDGDMATHLVKVFLLSFSMISLIVPSYRAQNV